MDKKQVSKERTMYVKKCFSQKNSFWNTARGIYFKVCLLKGKQPRYKEFMIVMDIREVALADGSCIIKTNDKLLECRYLDAALQKLYSKWKKSNPFCACEYDFICRRGISGSIQVILNLE